MSESPPPRKKKVSKSLQFKNKKTAVKKSEKAIFWKNSFHLIPQNYRGKKVKPFLMKPVTTKESHMT
jgi:hypothetical protein